MNCWWKLEGEYVCIYTEDLKLAKKINYTPMATYEKQSKIFAYQYRVEKFSKEYNKLWKLLGLTNKDEYKLTNKRAKKKIG